MYGFKMTYRGGRKAAGGEAEAREGKKGERRDGKGERERRVEKRKEMLDFLTSYAALVTSRVLLKNMCLCSKNALKLTYSNV